MVSHWYWDYFTFTMPAVTWIETQNPSNEMHCNLTDPFYHAVPCNFPVSLMFELMFSKRTTEYSLRANKWTTVVSMKKAVLDCLFTVLYSSNPVSPLASSGTVVCFISQCEKLYLHLFLGFLFLQAFSVYSAYVEHFSAIH